jgi:nucleotide-binding universal stress UspA family protein
VIALPRVPSFLRAAVHPPDALLDQIAPEVHGGLRGLASTLGAERPRTELLVGMPSERLAACATDFGADLVVVGRTGQRAGTWKRIGSTADRLMRQLNVPVLIATGELKEPPRRILAAVDDAEIGREVVHTSQLLATRFGADLVAMHVLSDRVRAYAMAAFPVTADVRAQHAAADVSIRDSAREWLRNELRGAGVTGPLRVEVPVGDVGNEILAAADRLEADLIVVGSYGADATVRNGTGGVTRFIVRGTRCPVLVVGNGPVARLRIAPVGRSAAERPAVAGERRSTTTVRRHDPGHPPAAIRSTG